MVNTENIVEKLQEILSKLEEKSRFNEQEILKFQQDALNIWNNASKEEQQTILENYDIFDIACALECPNLVRSLLKAASFEQVERMLETQDFPIVEENGHIYVRVQSEDILPLLQEAYESLHPAEEKEVACTGEQGVDPYEIE